MKVCIVGSRDFPVEEGTSLVEGILEDISKRWDPDMTIISGGAPGVDTWVARNAAYQGLPFVEYPADWGLLGKAAGAIRNRLMVEDADYVIALWDGKSRGTRITIDFALELRKDLEVHFG